LSSFYFSAQEILADCGDVFKYSLSASVFSHDEGAKEDYVVLKQKSATVISISVVLETIAQWW